MPISRCAPGLELVFRSDDENHIIPMTERAGTDKQVSTLKNNSKVTPGTLHTLQWSIFMTASNKSLTRSEIGRFCEH